MRGLRVLLRDELLRVRGLRVLLRNKLSRLRQSHDDGGDVEMKNALRGVASIAVVVLR